jgi:hypothetical protein
VKLRASYAKLGSVMFHFLAKVWRPRSAARVDAKDATKMIETNFIILGSEAFYFILFYFIVCCWKPICEIGSASLSEIDGKRIRPAKRFAVLADPLV